MNAIISALISGFLLPMLAKCQSQTSSEDPQEFLKSHYDASTGKFDPDVVRDAIPATRRATRKAYRAATREEQRDWPRLDRRGFYELAETNLKEAMEAPPEKVAAVMSSAQTLPDGDE